MSCRHFASSRATFIHYFCFRCCQVFVYGSKIGWYHLIFLPLILLEMESGDPAFLGEPCALG